MRPALECAQCGNPRLLLPQDCPSCGSAETPYAHVEFWRVDLEQGAPTVEQALDHLTRAMRAGSDAGLRALIVVHGYGSSGAGGRIGDAVREGLANNFWADRVEEFIACEELVQGSQLMSDLTRQRAVLTKELRRGRMLGNAGVSVLLFRKLEF
ncbi:MAG: Smr/MutS family protein [Burkholderiales bacterium]